VTICACRRVRLTWLDVWLDSLTCGLLAGNEYVTGFAFRINLNGVLRPGQVVSLLWNADAMKYVIFMLALTVTSLTYATECDIDEKVASEKLINSKIYQSNYCKSDADCRFVQLGCPFGCNTPINRSKVVAIRSEIEKHHEAFTSCSLCAYDCVLVEGVRCEKNRCSTY